MEAAGGQAPPEIASPLPKGNNSNSKIGREMGKSSSHVSLHKKTQSMPSPSPVKRSLDTRIGAAAGAA